MGDRGADGSDNDAASLYYVWRIGDDAELLRADVDADVTQPIKIIAHSSNILVVSSDFMHDISVLAIVYVARAADT